MQQFILHLPAILGVLVLLLMCLCTIYILLTLPRKSQVEALKEWLKWAVVFAEKKLGSGTGQIKLREVYDMAITTFPWIMRKLSFEGFSLFVDEALVWMKDQLEKNTNIQEYIRGDQNENFAERD